MTDWLDLYSLHGVYMQSSNGRWVFIPDESVDEEPYDNAKDHQPCDDCNPGGKGRDPGWYNGATIREHCKRCEGAGWL